MMKPEISPSYADQAKPYHPEGPQPLLRPIPPGAPYPVEALGPLEAVVRAVHDITQAPIAIPAQSALAVASLAVQAFVNVQTLGGDAPCSLFCLTIAESGERKSASDRLFMRPFQLHERAQEAQYREEMEAYTLAHDIWAAKRKKMLDGATKKDRTASTGSEADLRALGAEPRPPLFPNILAQDPTFEGLLKLYQSGRPSLGLFSDEGGGFIGGHAMSNDNRLKTIAGLSQLWNGDPVNRVRAGDGPSTYPGRRLALHLMAQPIAARPLLADPQASGQGFLARFLISEPPSAIGTRLRRGHSPASDAALLRYEDRMAQLLALPLPTGEQLQELTPRRLTLSKAAADALWEFSEATEVEQAPGGSMEHIRAYASKSAEQAARIAGVLTIWGNIDALEVGRQEMEWGITLAQYYLAEAKRLAEAGLVSEVTAKAEQLRVWLASLPHDEVTPAEILRNGPNALRELKALREPLSLLLSAGHLVALPEGTTIRGRSRKVAYSIVRGT